MGNFKHSKSEKPEMTMITSSQINPGMTIGVDDHFYQVISSVKVTATKSTPFIKAKLKDLITQKILEKSFKLDQSIFEVVLIERDLEFLYFEKEDEGREGYLFLDTKTLEQILVPSEVIGDRANYLKEGINVKAIGYQSTVFSVELPQFLELVITKTEMPNESSPLSNLSNATKMADLETGAKIEVPLFVEAGDIVKIDTYTNEYIQRV